MRTTLPSGTPAEVAVGDRFAPGGRGVVVAPDIMGLRPLFDAQVARLADEDGWAVCAVEPFPGREDLPIEERLQLPHDEERLLGDLTAAADHLASLGAGPVGIVGFCMGGMLVHKAAGTGRFDRGVSFYGMITTPERWRSPSTVEPLDQLARPGAAQVLAIIGGRDHYTPADEVDRLEALPNVEVVRYPDAEHGFAHDADRPAHRPDDAADAWSRAVAFLTT